MIELDQMKLELQQYEKPLEEVRDSLDLDFKKQRIEELSRESEAPDFWSNADVANKKMKQLKDLQNRAARRAATGAPCSTECIQDGQTAKDSALKS